MAKFRVQHTLPVWRRIALSTWSRGDDPTIYGTIDVDATELLRYVDSAREVSGVRVTLTHVVGKAIANAFARFPEFNGIVSFGRLKLRDTVDVFFQVSTDDGRNLSGAKVEGADQLSAMDIAQTLDDSVKRIRHRRDTALQKSQGLLGVVPGFALGPIMKAAESLTYDFGLNLSGLGVPFDPFGTVMVTNVGVFNIEQGFAPLFPTGRVPAVLCMGVVRDKVIAIEGKPVVRPVLSIGATFDHRVIDGAGIGKLHSVFRPILEDPFGKLGDPKNRNT